MGNGNRSRDVSRCQVKGTNCRSKAREHALTHTYLNNQHLVKNIHGHPAPSIRSVEYLVSKNNSKIFVLDASRSAQSPRIWLLPVSITICGSTQIKVFSRWGKSTSLQQPQLPYILAYVLVFSTRQQATRIHTICMLLVYQQCLLNVRQTMADIFQDVRTFAHSKSSHKFTDIFITCHWGGGMCYVTVAVSDIKQELPCCPETFMNRKDQLKYKIENTEVGICA